MRAARIGLALCALAGCGDDVLMEGEACTTSAECAEGLLCDTAQSPPVCARAGSPRPDLAGTGGDDLSAVSDLAQVD